MSQAQEERKAQTWENVHKPEFERRAAELRIFLAEIEALPDGSDERVAKQRMYDELASDLIAYGIKFHES